MQCGYTGPKKKKKKPNSYPRQNAQEQCEIYHHTAQKNKYSNTFFYGHIYVHVCVCARMWRANNCLGYHSREQCISFETGSLVDLELTHKARLAEP